MAGVQSKLFSLCLMDLVSLFLPGKSQVSQLGVPLPKPFELGVGMTEKGEERGVQHPRAGSLLGKQQMLAWQEAL